MVDKKPGGMFAKDKEIGNRVDAEFDLGEHFILWSAVVQAEKVDTEIGKASKTVLEVSRPESPDMRFECTTLASAIADKAAEAMTDDFPCVVELRKVESKYGNDALVLQWVSDWKA